MKKVESYSRFTIWSLALLLSALAAGCGEGRDPILGINADNDIRRPTVTFTEPATTTPGPTTGVPVDTAITALFSEEMAPATITATGTFTLTCAACAVSPTGTVSYTVGSRTATFTPLPLLENSKTYTATITTAATDLAGNALAGNQASFPTPSNYVWTFTTVATPPLSDTTRPRVTVTQPATTTPGPTPNVPDNTSIAAVFTEEMAPATITATSFTLTCGTCVVTNPTGNVNYAVGTRTASFTPLSTLEVGRTYTATIVGTGATPATDVATNALAGNQAPLPAPSDYIWSFTTVAAAAAPISVVSTNPANLATGICPSATINATFNNSSFRMDPATVNATTFTLTGPGLTPVTAESIVLDDATGRIATFTPLNDLTDGVLYTATIESGPSGVKDLAVPANEMASDKIWTFTAGPVSGCGPQTQQVTLASAAPFGTMGGYAGMTNQGTLTVINGDIGTTAASTAVTGFHDAGPGCTYTETPSNIGTVNGKIYTAAPPPTVACPQEGTAETFQIARQGEQDALAAYNYLAGLPGLCAPPCVANLSGVTLFPGVYAAPGGAFLIDGLNDLTLDGQGDANAVWVFQMATTLTVGGAALADSRSVQLINGAQAKNVFWQVGSFATINPAGGGTMVGTIISQAGASFSTAGNNAPNQIVTLNGRVLSLGASVTVVNTIINVPSP